ncbi:MAG: transcriptional regulator [Bacteroidetes bacterium RBG_13_44_24]|nr:MAG: transcriptional regulator [Bacteroidetes bacterium RBG_13_44_24]
MRQNKTIQQKFGNRVRKLRKSKGWSQEGFADECGLHRTYIGSIERGERNVSLNNIHAIAKAIGISVKELFDY